MGVTLRVDGDGRVVGVGIVNRHARVVDDDEVPIISRADILAIASAQGDRGRLSSDETEVILELPVWIENGEVDLTAVVRGDVDHRLCQQGHRVRASRAGWEFVHLTAGVGVPDR